MTTVSSPATAPASQGERVSAGATTKAILRALGRSSLVALSTFVIIVLIWLAVVYLTGVSPYVAKGPLDVVDFLFLDEDAGENRAVLGANLAVTLEHSAVGFLAGLAVAIVGAILFRLSRTVESALMPVATLLRSVPLVALAPVIILIFGFGTDASVAVIGGIVVLFPALVTIAFGLKNASPQMLDVVSVYGGSTWTAIRKVALPGALPSLFAAIRVSVPGAITGALLAEILSTGNGIGRAGVEFAAQAKFPDLWAAVVMITIVSVALYQVVQVIEAVVLARMGMADRA
ncbi:ABC transporter permease [Herbiconiux sp. L3-i23]|uniref:ABC transporter permease n=1 Tax=Herbiconiux sp. L3-i23 TaxID=2905871 RepID=UPI002054F1CB|nr:ABC transporter permease subunit [Herbiconiux sp. L3-i23]BDI21438.1 ABC transporter permease [Herbiconiux sp. L3-i23]